MTTTNNAVALGWKYPGVGGISTKEGVITNWPGSLPPLTQELVDAIEAEYLLQTEWLKNRLEKSVEDKGYGTFGQQKAVAYDAYNAHVGTEAEKITAGLTAWFNIDTVAKETFKKPTDET